MYRRSGPDPGTEGSMQRRGHGKIVNNASIAAYAAFPGASVYEPHLDDTSKIEGIEPGEWAARIVRAIESDYEALNPTGAERLSA